VPRVNSCPECGNHDMHVRVLDGAAVHVCALCGTSFGERRTVDALAASEEAASAGTAPAVWPLVRVLQRLPGLEVQCSGGGDAERASLPFVELTATSATALVQLENVAKSLALAAGALRVRWTVEIAYERTLTFVLRPASGGADVAGRARDARADVAVLARALERDMRLSWWRDGDGERSG
jgi:hypothetical protein